MLKEIKSAVERLRLKYSKRKTVDLLPEGYHGDKHLIKIIDDLMATGVTYFIETGTNVGSTLSFMAKKYSDLHCISCEPDEKEYKMACKNTNELSNVSIYRETSQRFIKRLKQEYEHTFDRKVIFWLDAHGYGFKWPLKEELNFIMSNYKKAYILVDDFKVPHLKQFIYDEYGHQVCSFEYVKDSIPEVSYELYYPNYTEKTSAYHPLKGWGLIVINSDLSPIIENNKIINAKDI